MFSFEQGRKVAVIKGGARDGQYLYMRESKMGLKEVVMGKDEKLQPVPDRDIVEKVLVSACSGAGKSTFVGNWVREFKKMFRKDEIYLFSSVDEDKALDRQDPTRIILDDDLLNDPIDIKELSQSLIIMDDVDTLRNKEMRVYLEGLRDEILEIGRHYDVRMLITSHLLSNYSATRRVLNEATCVVLFPRAGGIHQIKNFLVKYCGLDKAQIKRFLNLPSRWVAIYRSYPQYVIYERGVYVPSSDLYE